MRRLLASCLLLCTALGVVAADEALPEAVKDPFYGQVLFDFHQQNYFSAITHLRAAQQRGGCRTMRRRPGCCSAASTSPMACRKMPK